VIYQIIMTIKRALKTADDEILESPLSATDLMLQVFEELRKNRPKPLQSHSLAGSQLNRGVSLSMPNMAVLQTTPAAPTESVHVSTDPPSADDLSTSSHKESVEVVELLASNPTIVTIANYSSPTFRYYIGAINAEVLAPAEVGDREVGSVSSATIPAEVRPAEVDAPQASVENGCLRPRRGASSMPNMAIEFGALVESEDSPTKPRAEETAAGLRDPDIQTSGAVVDAVETEQTTVTAVSPRRRRSLWRRTKRFVRLMFCSRLYIYSPQLKV